MKDFISIADIDRGKMDELFDLAADLKRDRTREPTSRGRRWLSCSTSRR